MIRLKKKEEKSGEGGEIEREIGRIHSSLSGYLHSRVGNVSMGEMNEIRNAKHLIFIARIYEIFPRVLYLPLSLSPFLSVFVEECYVGIQSLERTTGRASSSRSKKIHDFNKTRHDLARDLFPFLFFTSRKYRGKNRCSREISAN